MKTKLIFFVVALAVFLSKCTDNREAVSRMKAPKYSYIKLGNTRALGWLSHILQTEVDGFSGHMDEFSPELIRKPFLVRTIPDIKRGAIWWDGESAGNWRDGFVRLAITTRDPLLMEKSRDWIRQLMELQQTEDEPYIGVYPVTHPKGNRWESVTGELWPQSRAYLAMLAWYEFTGDQQVLDAVIKAADLTLENFFRERDDLDTANFQRSAVPNINTHALMIVEPMLQLYEITGEQKYLEFSEFIYDKLQFHNNALLRGVRFLHGVHVCENARIPAMLYAYNRNPEYLDISEKITELVIRDYLNCMGALRADEWVSIAKPNQASEYCTLTEWVMTVTEMTRITGNMKYADLTEKCFFNAAMGARLTNGKGIQYLGYPNQLIADYRNDPQVSYGPNHWPLCCNPNATRLFPYYTNSMWMKKGDDGLAAVLYGPAEIKFSPGDSETQVQITEETIYPFSEEIRFAFKCDAPVEFPITFRIPSWCENPSMEINRESIEIIIEPGNTHTVSRTWQTGDIIVLHLPMKIGLEYNRFSEMVSVVRGPLVYALEVPSETEDLNEVAPGYSYRNFYPKPDFMWNVALVYDETNPEPSFRFIPQELPGNEGELWDYPTGKIETKAQVVDHWCHTCSGRKINQPPVPLSPLLNSMRKEDKDQTIYLVPLGITKLRITAFPYFTKIY